MEKLIFYLLPEDIPDDLLVNAHIIDCWGEFEFYDHEELCEDAKRFISIAWSMSKFTNIHGLIAGLNDESISDMNLFFMTAKWSFKELFFAHLINK